LYTECHAVVYIIWIRKPEGKRTVGKYRHGRENNIKMNFKAAIWDM
jgi:hypothetical protein